MAQSPESAVEDYLRAQNRPYSANDIVLNLHKEHGKTAVQKALDLLVADGKVAEKLNGKQKAYVIHQSSMPASSEAELAALDRELSEAEAEGRSLSENLKALTAQHRALVAFPPNHEVIDMIAVLEKENEALEARLAKLSNNQDLMSRKDKRKLEQSHELAVKEWRKRKRICVSITDAILESYPKPKKALFEDVGIETDEDVGVKIPDI